MNDQGSSVLHVVVKYRLYQWFRQIYIHVIFNFISNSNVHLLDFSFYMPLNFSWVVLSCVKKIILVCLFI
jgi:hypothetical protein